MVLAVLSTRHRGTVSLVAAISGMGWIVTVVSFSCSGAIFRKWSIIASTVSTKTVLPAALSRNPRTDNHGAVCASGAAVNPGHTAYANGLLTTVVSDARQTPARKNLHQSAVPGPGDRDADVCLCRPRSRGRPSRPAPRTTLL